MGPLMPSAPPTQVDAAFEAMEATRYSQRLRWLYLWTGLLWCACSVGPMTLQEAGGIPMAVGYLASLGIAWKLHKYLWREPLLVMLALWAIWVAASLLWSIEPRKGGRDLSSLRFIWTIPALWLLMRDRPKLILAV